MTQIAVIVPVYNVSKYLRACVDSLLSQDCSDLRIILVDDGSTDDSGSICEEYARHDGRVSVVHTRNGGQSSARNRGLEVARQHHAEYVAFVDSDDCVSPEYFSVLLRGFEFPVDVSCVHCFVGADGEPIRYVLSDRMTAAVSPAAYWNEDSYRNSAWAKLFRLRLFDGFVFPEGRIHEDEFVIYRLLFAGDLIAVNDSCLYYYRQRAGSTVHAVDACRERKRLLDQMSAMMCQLRFFIGCGRFTFAASAFSRIAKNCVKYVLTLRGCHWRSLIVKRESEDARA